MSDKIISCQQAKALFGLDVECCDSCHDDSEMYGVDMIHETIGKYTAIICCSVSVALDNRLSEVCGGSE